MIKTRIAPSPTGYMHIGNVRTALFAWLLARQNNGQFVLRIEDTDRNRFTEGAEEHIVESLKWLGLDWDAGPDKPDELGPYRQSQRLEIFNKYAQKLIKSGKAYADPTTPNQLAELREKAKAEKRPFRFREHRPENPPEWRPGLSLRLRIDADKSPDWHDEVRGDIKGSSENIDDFILVKADGFPTYNFAHIVDDHEMQITHVIRGDEFISSVPKYLFLYEALGVKPPVFAHLPPILAPDGKKKLSKRDGAPDLLSYRDQGYMPEAVANFLALLGWNDGTEQEMYSIKELIEKFSLNRVQKSGARYDEQKLTWISGHHIRSTKLEDLYKLTTSPKNWWPESASSTSDEEKLKILGLVQEKLKNFNELSDNVRFFFVEPEISLDEVLGLDKQLSKKLELTEAKKMLESVTSELEQCDFSVGDLETRLREMVEKLETKAGILFKLIRISITGSTVAPGLFETMEALGKETILKRLAKII